MTFSESSRIGGVLTAGGAVQDGNIAERHGGGFVMQGRFNTVNLIDTTGLECLRSCRASLAEAGVDLHLAEVKGPVMDRLRRAGFVDELGEDHFWLSTHLAVEALEARDAAGHE